MKRGDVFEARLSPTEGSEQSGIRPVVIVSRDAINKNSPIIVIAPLTKASNVKRSYPNNVHVSTSEAGLSFDSVVLGGQVRAISKSRLLNKRGSLTLDTLKQVDNALRITLAL